MTVDIWSCVFGLAIGFIVGRVSSPTIPESSKHEIVIRLLKDG